MTRNEKIQFIAAKAIWETLSDGAKKPRAQHWADESPDMHLDKAVRHLMTHRLMRDGHQPHNGENHLKLALTRVAMALAIEQV